MGKTGKVKTGLSSGTTKPRDPEFARKTWEAEDSAQHVEHGGAKLQRNLFVEDP